MCDRQNTWHILAADIANEGHFKYKSLISKFRYLRVVAVLWTYLLLNSNPISPISWRMQHLSRLQQPRSPVIPSASTYTKPWALSQLMSIGCLITKLENTQSINIAKIIGTSTSFLLKTSACFNTNRKLTFTGMPICCLSCFWVLSWVMVR